MKSYAFVLHASQTNHTLIDRTPLAIYIELKSICKKWAYPRTRWAQRCATELGVAVVGDVALLGVVLHGSTRSRAVLRDSARCSTVPRAWLGSARRGSVVQFGSSISRVRLERNGAQWRLVWRRWSGMAWLVRGRVQRYMLSGVHTRLPLPAE